MAELGELLEWLHRPARDFRRVRVEFRLWRHDERAHAAFVADLEDSQARVARATAVDAEPQDPEREGLWRVWFERPDRVREEREGEGWLGRTLGVRVGAGWWTYNEHTGAITNEGDESITGGVGQELEVLLDPARLIGLLELEPLGGGRRADRDVLRARAHPRVGRREHRAWDLNPLGAGADEYELEVDAERGLLVRVAARRDGLAFQLIEATHIAFDEPFPPDTFVFEAPAGERVEPVGDRIPIWHLPLHEAAQRSPFTVFMLGRPPADWHLEASFHPAADRPPHPAQVILSYRAEDARMVLSILQTAADEALSLSAGANGPPWQDIERDGIALRARRRTERWPQSEVSVIRAETAINMTSGELDVDALADLAAQLAPAPTTPPS